MPVDIIAGVILVAVLAAAIGYIIKSKKSGAKCIGCPHSKVCSSKEKSNCGCGCESQQDKQSK